MAAKSNPPLPLGKKGEFKTMAEGVGFEHIIYNANHWLLLMNKNHKSKDLWFLRNRKDIYNKQQENVKP